MDIYVLAIDGGDSAQANFSILPESSDVGSVTIDVFTTHSEAMEKAIECVEAEIARFDSVDSDVKLTDTHKSELARMRDTLNNPDDRMEAADEIFGYCREEQGGIKILQFGL